MSTSYSKGFTGRGTVLSMGVSPASTFTPVAQVKTWQFAGQKWSYDDLTNGNSPAVGPGVQKESIPSVVDPGEISIGGVYLASDAGQAMLATAFNSGVLYDFKLQLPPAPGETTGELKTFSGYVEDPAYPDIQFDKTLTFKTTIKLNTMVTTTAGS
ncbi:MAG TPA: hypothetical protein VGS10_11480 [Terracidiphilus sp.]|nr:hypothetical protein [Terracidiphilus sp.]